MKQRITTLTDWISELRRAELKSFQILIPKQKEDGVKNIRFTSNSEMPIFFYFTK